MVHRFSTYVFDDQALELSREGRVVRLEPQPARALALLVAHAGEVVTRDELRLAIWGAETHVDYDRGLAYCIGQVRTALGDSAEQPRFVQTLPKRGFRFLAQVTPLHPAVSAASTAADDAVAGRAAPPANVAAAAPSAARWRQWALAGAVLLLAGAGWRLLAPPRPVVVAVSIFDNETGDAAHDAFVVGLSDLAVTQLTHLAPVRLGVIGNAAVLRRPRNIRNLETLAATLDADYVVLGQLQRQDEGVRFIVHFIRLADGVHLSARRFVRPASEVRAFEGDVLAEIERVVRALALTGA